MLKCCSQLEDVCFSSWQQPLASKVTYNRFHTTAICSPTRASLTLGATFWSISMCQQLSKSKSIGWYVQVMKNLDDSRSIFLLSFMNPTFLDCFTKLFHKTPWNSACSRKRCLTVRCHFLATGYLMETRSGSPIFFTKCE